MVQIGIAIVGVVLIITGIRALMGTEPHTAAKKEYGSTKDQTSPGVAIASIVIGVFLIIFAGIGLPLIIQML